MARHVLAGMIALGTCTTCAAGPRPPGPPVGVATRDADGTIILRLRSVDRKGMIAEGLFRYRPGEPDYAAIARHVGPIPNGGSVPVRPFPR